MHIREATAPSRRANDVVAFLVGIASLQRNSRKATFPEFRRTPLLVGGPGDPLFSVATSMVHWDPADTGSLRSPAKVRTARSAPIAKQERKVFLIRRGTTRGEMEG